MFNDHQADLINKALDGVLEPGEREVFNTLLNDSPEDAARWRSVQKVDNLLRQKSMVGPPPDFTARVMAQIHAEATRTPTPDKNPIFLPLVLGGITVVGVVVFIIVRAALIQLLGPLPALDELLNQIGVFLTDLLGVVQWLVEWLGDFVARFPMLPAMGVASIPLAFALTWLVVYYTPKDRIRRAARYLAS